MKKSIRICLAWHNLNSPNFGVSALTISHVVILKEMSEKLCVPFVIETLGTPNVSSLLVGDYIERLFGLKIIHHEFSFKNFLKATVRLDFAEMYLFKKYDWILDIGEGDSFSDLYGLRRFLLLSFSKFLGYVSGARLIIAPQTIGPFNSKAARFIAKIILGRADRIYVRDRPSADCVADLGLKCEEVSDLAFGLPYCQSKRANGNVGINISALLWHGGYSGENQFGLTVDYPEMVLNLIRAFRQKGQKIYLVAHVIADSLPIEDDYRVCIEVKKHFLEDENVIVAPKFADPVEAKSYISGMSFFVGSRMHAVVAALSSGVICVPVAYSRKFEGLFGSLGYSYTINAYSEKCDCVEIIMNLYDNCQQEMLEKCNAARDRALEKNRDYIDYLKEVLIYGQN